MSERLRARGRRLGEPGLPGTAIDDLRAGVARDATARRRGLPLAVIDGVATFYDRFRGEGDDRVCDGTACHFAGARGGGVRCLGRCYAAPARADVEAPAIPRRSLVDSPVVLRHLLGGTRARDFDYDLPGGEAILAAVEASGLRGRGGAAFPTAAKWKVARDTPASEKFVVANGDEGDPGAYVDRLLLEEDPHAVLAGMLACARAIGARRGIVYIRAEYPAAQAAVRAAIAEAPLGDELQVEVVSGAGAYVCGEESALLNAIEGFRGEPRPRPPYAAVSGLYGMPTVVQNVETLAVAPWVVKTGRGGGTKAFCLSGAVDRPGVVEAALGTPLRALLDDAGAREPTMALVGGPLGRVVGARDFDTPLSFDALPGMGHGGIVALDASVTPRALAEHLFAFARAESCGNCAPCRLGCAQLERLGDRAALERLLTTMEMGSLCGFGQGVGRPIRDLLALFGEEVLR